MQKTILPIKGMHCRSCELLIEDKLKEIPGIKGVSVDFHKKQAEFFLNYPATMEKVTTAVVDAGYEVGAERKEWYSQNQKDYQDLGVAFLILMVLYFVAKKFGIINLNISGANNHSSLGIIFLVGLTAGVSTCMAMVGGLILGVSARFSEKHPEATPAQKFRPHLFFISGRIVSYFVLGGLIGLIGKAFQLSSLTLGTLTIIVGVVMLVLGIQLTEIFPKISSANFTLPSGLAKLLGIKRRHEKEYSHTNSFITGALTFFLPCGFTQAMQLYAMSTGNFWTGAAIMGVFALGTAPGLLGVGGLTSLVKGAFAKKFFKFAGLLVIFLALFNISNGLNLTGWKSIISFSSGTEARIKDDPNVKLENGIQVVNMTQTSYGYSPNEFTIKKGVPVKWVINSTDPNSCASSLLAPKINVRKVLRAGQNIIEFTPDSTGIINFTCSMGMFNGRFKVVENTLPTSTNTSISPSNQKTASPSSSVSASSSLAIISPDTQVIQTTFINPTVDIQPKNFTVQAGKPVRFEITANADGLGCMSTIGVPGLVDAPEFIEKGKTIVFNFTPTQKGRYEITCAMGAPRGTITVN